VTEKGLDDCTHYVVTRSRRADECIDQLTGGEAVWCETIDEAKRLANERMCATDEVQYIHVLSVERVLVPTLTFEDA